jgi:pyruvate/2-oxoglutarate dehydrogenase complex dihydrolipoamide dehydrogenase (E3) component
VSLSFDAIIVGAGQAGPPLAEKLTAAGWTVAVIERKLFGGTCVNVGCTPTKALLASAQVAHYNRRAEDFGVNPSIAVTVDMARVKRRMRSILSASRNGIESWLRTMEGCTVYEGHAQFISPTEIRVNDHVLRSSSIFLNVGARPSVIGLNLVGVPYLTSSSILDLDELPSKLAVIGGGSIGVEFAQMYRRFGAEVVIIERGPMLVPHEDKEASVEIERILSAEGVEMRFNAKCIAVRPAKEGITVILDCQQGESEVQASHVLLALGRIPNTDDLALDKAGVVITEHGYIAVDDQLRSSIPGIWALGDCNGRGAFTHTAFNDYEIVAANVLGGAQRLVSDRIPVHALFTDPPLAQVGLTEQQVRRRGRPALVGYRLMSGVGRAVAKSEAQGFIKIFVDTASREILGATILGTSGDEAIHCILTAMQLGATAQSIERSMYIHPTVAELIPTILRELRPLI